jgi:hypothetical protein
LKEREGEGANDRDLIFQTTTFVLARGYDVILEGMLVFARYGAMLRELTRRCPEHYVFFMDVSLEETLRRHATKPIAHAVAEQNLRDWYRPLDVTGFAGEIVIPECLSAEESVELIVRTAGLG